MRRTKPQEAKARALQLWTAPEVYRHFNTARWRRETVEDLEVAFTLEYGERYGLDNLEIQSLRNDGRERFRAARWLNGLEHHPGWWRPIGTLPDSRPFAMFSWRPGTWTLAAWEVTGNTLKQVIYDSELTSHRPDDKHPATAEWSSEELDFRCVEVYRNPEDQNALEELREKLGAGPWDISQLSESKAMFIRGCYSLLRQPPLEHP